MRKILFTLILASLSFTLDAADTTPASPNEIRPILLNMPVPEVTLFTLDGKSVSLKSQLNGRPAVIVFYRGGWCPYCSLQLGGLKKIKNQLDKLGVQIIAVSPDRPEALKASIDKADLDYTLLSDSKSDAINAFGIAYVVDAKTLEQLKSYNIDLNKASGENHNTLPVPSVYIADSEAKLQFSYVNPDYTARLPESVILEAAKVIADKKQYLQPKM